MSFWDLFGFGGLGVGDEPMSFPLQQLTMQPAYQPSPAEMQSLALYQSLRNATPEELALRYGYLTANVQPPKPKIQIGATDI